MAQCMLAFTAARQAHQSDTIHLLRGMSGGDSSTLFSGDQLRSDSLLRLLGTFLTPLSRVCSFKNKNLVPDRFHIGPIYSFKLRETSVTLCIGWPLF